MPKALKSKPDAFRNRIVGHAVLAPKDIRANARNWRTHPPAQRQAMRAALKQIGFIQQVVINRRSQTLIDGHLRVELALEDGQKEVPVTYVDLSPSEERAALATFDPLGAMATTDKKNLESLLNSIENEGKDMRSLLERMAKQNKINVPWLFNNAVAADAIPPVPDKPITQSGELWQMGEHRLLCGDSTNPDDVALLMDGEKAALMNTDPPYGINYGDLIESKNDGKGSKQAHITNDDLDGAGLQEFLERIIRTAVPHLIENPAFYLWHPMLTQGTFFAAAAAADILIHRQIIWVKPSLILGRGDYHWRHELAFYGWIKGKRCQWLGDRAQDTVWEVGRETDGIHPTQKPVELFLRPIRFHTKAEDVVYEPFGGSGSQFIAAEMESRRCYGLELEPKYCDVIVKRWENFTGQKAERVSRD